MSYHQFSEVVCVKASSHLNLSPWLCVRVYGVEIDIGLLLKLIGSYHRFSEVVCGKASLILCTMLLSMESMVICA